MNNYNEVNDHEQHCSWLVWPFLWRQKDKTSFSFLISKLFANKVNFQPQFIVNQLLVVCIHLESFLPSLYKFGMVYTLVYRCFRICSDWKKFHAELTFLKTIFCRNGYPENFIDVLDNIHLVKEKVPTVERKRLLLVLPYLGVISLQTRTKLQQAIKGVLNCCKLEIAFKCQTNLSNSFRFKDPIPKDLISGIVYKFQCGLCNESYYDKGIRHLDIRSGSTQMCHLILERRPNQSRTVLFVIIYFIAIIYLLLTTLAF